MAQYNTPQALRPLEKLICDFAYSNGCKHSINSPFHSKNVILLL